MLTVLGFFAAAVLFTLIGIVWERLRQQRLARSRFAWSRDRFRNSLLAAGVSDDLEAFFWDEIQPYYVGGLRPQPDDLWQTTLRGDPLDLIDITDRLWKKKGWGEPDYDQYPALDPDATLLDFARWLQHHENSHNIQSPQVV